MFSHRKQDVPVRKMAWESPDCSPSVIKSPFLCYGSPLSLEGALCPLAVFCRASPTSRLVFVRQGRRPDFKSANGFSGWVSGFGLGVVGKGICYNTKVVGKLRGGRSRLL